eukprot:3933560-Amphidinium_carterae.2
MRLLPRAVLFKHLLALSRSAKRFKAAFPDYFQPSSSTESSVALPLQDALFELAAIIGRIRGVHTAIICDKLSTHTLWAGIWGSSATRPELSLQMFGINGTPSRVVIPEYGP